MEGHGRRRYRLMIKIKAGCSKPIFFQKMNNWGF